MPLKAWDSKDDNARRSNRVNSAYKERKHEENAKKYWVTKEDNWDGEWHFEPWTSEGDRKDDRIEEHQWEHVSLNCIWGLLNPKRNFAQ